MAAVPGFSPSSSSALKPHQKWQKPLIFSRPYAVLGPRPLQSIAGDISADISSSTARANKIIRPAVATKDPIDLWHRYVDWMYQHKDLGLYVDVSRIGFSDEFFEEMEPKMQKAFEAMKELEKGAIANPDEGRMVGHYWLRNPKMAPTQFLKTQIEKMLEVICEFADKIISAEVRVSVFETVDF